MGVAWVGVRVEVGVGGGGGEMEVCSPDSDTPDLRGRVQQQQQHEQEAVLVDSAPTAARTHSLTRSPLTTIHHLTPTSSLPSPLPPRAGWLPVSWVACCSFSTLGGSDAVRCDAVRCGAARSVRGGLWRSRWLVGWARTIALSSQLVSITSPTHAHPHRGEETEDGGVGVAG